MQTPTVSEGPRSMPKEVPVVFADAATENDELGRERHVRALSELIRSAKTPLVVALYGSWGAGKTSMMLQLRRLLDPNHDGKHPDLHYPASARSVWFDPWIHQFDNTPALGLLHAATEQLGLSTQLTVKDALVKIAVALTEDIRVPYVGVRLGRLTKIKSEVEESEFRRREEQVKLRDHFRTVLDSAVEGKNRVVFFIDDLDRCQPKQALSMLEALKLYLDFEGCVYVLGVDRAPLEASVRAEYDAIGLSAESYLDKIVQLPFAIPTIDHGAMKQFVDQRVPGKLKSCKDILAEAGADDPRQVKRILNSLIFNDHLVDADQFKPPYDPKILAAVVLIQNLAPESYRLLRLKPSNIHELFADIRKKEVEPEGVSESSEAETPAEEPVEADVAARAGGSQSKLWKDVKSKPRLVAALRLIEVPTDLDLRPYLTLTSTVGVESEAPDDQVLLRVKLAIDEMQKHFLELLKNNRDQEALQESQKTLRMLEEADKKFPRDPYLRVTRGYIYKNIATALRRLGEMAESDKVLTEAEQTFRDLSIETPDDAAVWNGLGSVAALRGDYASALKYIDQALEIDPDYEAAKNDRAMIKRYLRKPRPDMDRGPSREASPAPR